MRYVKLGKSTDIISFVSHKKPDKYEIAGPKIGAGFKAWNRDQ